ncbi:sensor histidine kinase [Massilia antarctica]|uniref:sensor histidine kinase n=1 Tax=Massilia antarctica TaxID=2765360 RepID=UPI0006BB67E6|nr:ATP-binding protein [Massilia sp. H27-R4]CUI05137.1 Signal transduction histidine kinase [Janthinobacterium sp. CG23_2]CUU28923.1 Signal transduction histidine kinase [Janthinobacterium sp. CG23_2]
MNKHLPAFDRQVSLRDMMRHVPAAALAAAMEHSVGHAWRIADIDDELVRAGALAIDGPVCTVALVVDIDVVGTLSAPAERQAWLAPAGKWIELLLGASNRYRMAADLHLETVMSDHDELMAKHAALATSEARYRTLSAQLEARVQEQVDQIEQSQRRMYQAEKMASIGSLAAGMAHEINNPIGFIRSNLSTAKEYVATLAQAIAAAPAAAKLAYVLDDFPNLINESIAGADRVSRIVADLKAYAHCEPAQFATIDPNDALRAAVRMLGDLPAGVRLETEFAALPQVACDPDGLTRVVLALLLNARTAMRERQGVIRLASAAHDGELLVSVSDQGCGIEDTVLPRIFDPFFTTHGVGGGIGLGLTVAADIVRAHSGHIALRSTAGGGSTFDVQIPLHAGGRG